MHKFGASCTPGPPGILRPVGDEIPGRGYERSDGGDQPLELRRYFDALRRSQWGLLAFVLLATGATVGVSLALSKSYTAKARILYNPSGDPLVGQSADVIQRQLATYGSLVMTPRVLGPVAKQVGTSEKQLEKTVSVSVDQTGNLLDVAATAPTPRRAQATAGAVARTFLTQQRRSDVVQLEAARARLREELARVRATPNSSTEVQAILSRLSDLTVSLASAGSELDLAESPQLPTSPSSPHPARNAVIAFFAAVFLGVVFVLGRDQLVPRIASARDLTRITDRPVLASVPFVRRRFGRQPKVLSAAEHEAYQTLQASLRFQLPPSEQHIVLVTSAREGDGKTTVTANVGRALARAGQKTLIVSADMRHPGLHELFGLDAAPGLAEVLMALEQDGDSPEQRTIPALSGLLSAQAGSKGNLHVLPSGKKPPDPARLLLSPATTVLLERFRALDYQYILLDGTPLLGLADSQALAQRVDDVLLVARLDRLNPEDVLEVRDLLDRLGVAPLGHVVIGGRRFGSSYYAEPTPELEAF
jgi:tyrosine-protein kinase